MDQCVYVDSPSSYLFSSSDWESPLLHFVVWKHHFILLPMTMSRVAFSIIYFLILADHKSFSSYHLFSIQNNKVTSWKSITKVTERFESTVVAASLGTLEFDLLYERATSSLHCTVLRAKVSSRWLVGRNLAIHLHLEHLCVRHKKNRTILQPVDCLLIMLNSF